MASDRVDTLSVKPNHNDTQDHSMTNDMKTILAEQSIKQNISVSSLPPIVLPKVRSTDDNMRIKNPFLIRLKYIIKTIFRYSVSY